MRLVFVTGSLVHGGAERHSITLMNRLAERGHECHAVYVKNDPGQLDRIELRHGGSAHCLDAARYLDRRAVARFAARLVELQPDAVVAANAYALMYASLARARARIDAPLLVTYHSTRLLGFKEQLKMLIDRFFFLAADCLVFVSDSQRRYWRRRGMSARRIETIHNGVDPARYDARAFDAAAQQLRLHHGIDATDYVVGMVAVLRVEKNPTQLVEAVARLRHLGIPATALLIGDGPLRAAVEALAQVLGIARHVVVAGLQQDVRPYVAACDVVALCSTTEAFSLAALEAMAMAKPVVLSEVGGAAEMVIPGHDGFLFPVGDTAALVAHLACLYDRNLARRLGANARRTAMQRFSEVAMLDRYERTLLQLCQARSDRHSATAHLAGDPGWPAAESPRQPRSETP